MSDDGKSDLSYRFQNFRGYRVLIEFEASQGYTAILINYQSVEVIRGTKV